MIQDRFSYFFLRIITYPFRFLPYRCLHWIGNAVGLLAFYCMPTYRKRTLSNLSLATAIPLSSEKELFQIARQSFQNLAINMLEYPKFDAESDFSRVIRCKNPQTAQTLYESGKGIIFFCGHQSNWEALFLDGTQRMKGIAIGKSIKNKRLYRWIVSIREKHGGKIISQRNALREGLRALRQGIFMGIVGDQGMPDSQYSFPFLGRRAWTSTAPALLSYKTNSPIIVATTKRISKGYEIHYSDPIWPDTSQSMETNVTLLMNQALTLLQNSILSAPGEWLWQHNRWKQQTPRTVYKRFRHDAVAVLLPDDKKEFEEIYPHLATLREIYSNDFLAFLAPDQFRAHLFDADDTIFYRSISELFRRDYRPKIIFNFTHLSVAKHYKTLSAFEVLTLSDLHDLALPHLHPSQSYTLSDVLKRALCRPGTLWSKHAS